MESHLPLALPAFMTSIQVTYPVSCVACTRTSSSFIWKSPLRTTCQLSRTCKAATDRICAKALLHTLWRVSATYILPPLNALSSRVHALDMITMAPYLTHCLQKSGAVVIVLSSQQHEQQQHAARDEPATCRVTLDCTRRLP